MPNLLTAEVKAIAYKRGYIVRARNHFRRRRFIRRPINNRLVHHKPKPKPKAKPKPKPHHTVPRDPNTIPLILDNAFTDTSAAAIVIGSEYVSYANQKKLDRLPGCHHDANQMHSILETKYGVPSSNIILLIDDGSHAAPIRSNILNALTYVLGKNIETIYFTYSGHGSTTTTGPGIATEPSRQNETIVPSDFLTAGQIIDTTLNEMLCNDLQSTTSHFIAIFDSCHSGTVLDLPYEFSARNPNVRLVGDKKDTISSKPCTVLSLSACLDSQTANSAYDLANSKTWQGALTFAFGQYSESLTGLPIRNQNGATLITTLQNILDRNGYSIQTTVLSSSKPATTASEIIFPFASS